MAGKERASKWETAGHKPEHHAAVSTDGLCPRCAQRLIPDYDGLWCPSCGHHTYERTRPPGELTRPPGDKTSLISSATVTRLRYAGDRKRLVDTTVDLEVCEGHGDAVRFSLLCVFCAKPMERTQENSFLKFACPQDHRIELVVKSGVASAWK